MFEKERNRTLRAPHRVEREGKKMFWTIVWIITAIVCGIISGFLFKRVLAEPIQMGRGEFEASFPELASAMLAAIAIFAAAAAIGRIFKWW